jgi:hypothetical protein
MWDHPESSEGDWGACWADRGACWAGPKELQPADRSAAPADAQRVGRPAAQVAVPKEVTRRRCRQSRPRGEEVGVRHCRPVVAAAV